MKKIEALIAPASFQSVRDGLAEIGINEITATEVKNFGRNTSHTEIFRGTQYTVDSVSRITDLDLVSALAR